MLLALPGCGSGKNTDVQNVLRVGSDGEPASLDPYLVTGHTEHRILTSLFEGLTTANQKTLEVEPGVAESWEVTPDGLTYTFKLNPNAKWSNGEPVTAHDFVYGWKRHLTAKLASEYAYMLWCLKNGEKYNKGEVADFNEVGAKAVDDTTLVVNLEYPAPYFLSMQIHYSWFPVHQATVEKFGPMDDRTNRWILPGNMVSNGPFKLISWEPNQSIRVEKNEHYWDAARIKLEAVEFYPSDDLSVQERRFRSKEVDVIETLLATKVDTYRKENPDVLFIEPFVGTYFYRFNTTRPPFNDVRVRRALAMAIDRESICRDVLYNVVVPAAAFTPPGLAGYTAEASIPYNLEEARNLLTEAGFPNGQGFPAVEILYNISEDHQRIAEAIQDMWKKNLGINVGPANKEWKVYLSSLTTLNYDIARSAWIADFMDPINYHECFITDGGNNRTGWSNAEFDRLVSEARFELDQTKRYAALQQAEKIMMEEAPIAPIYSYRQRFLKSPDVKGLDANVQGYLNYRYIYVERTAPESTGN